MHIHIYIHIEASSVSKSTTRERSHISLPKLRHHWLACKWALRPVCAGWLLHRRGLPWIAVRRKSKKNKKIEKVAAEPLLPTRCHFSYIQLVILLCDTDGFKQP